MLRFSSFLLHRRVKTLQEQISISEKTILEWKIKYEEEQDINRQQIRRLNKKITTLGKERDREKKTVQGSHVSQEMENNDMRLCVMIIRSLVVSQHLVLMFILAPILSYPIASHRILSPPPH